MRESPERAIRSAIARSEHLSAAVGTGGGHRAADELGDPRVIGACTAPAGPTDAERSVECPLVQAVLAVVEAPHSATVPVSIQAAHSYTVASPSI